jgi:hypothetical protein
MYFQPESQGSPSFGEGGIYSLFGLLGVLCVSSESDSYFDERVVKKDLAS